MNKVITTIQFLFKGKKIGHRFPPGKYTATLTKSRINKAGNLEITLTDVQPLKEELKHGFDSSEEVD